MTTVQVSVAATGDDGYFDNWNAYSTTAQNNRIGKGGAGGSRAETAIARFTGITIPAGATITNAYVTVTAGAEATNTVPMRIRAVDEDNPSFPADRATAAGKSLTTAYVDWTPGNWSADTTYNTPDLSSIIQELVDTYTISNDAIIIYIGDNGASNSTERLIRDYTNNSAKVPVLNIEYSAGTAANVDAVKAELSGEAKAASVSAGVDIGADIADGNILAYAPTVSGGAVIPAEVLAVAGQMQVEAKTPALSGNANVIGEAAQAQIEAKASIVSGEVSLQAEAAAIDGSALEPIITALANLSAETAQLAIYTPIPTVTAGSSIPADVNAEISTASMDADAPTIQAAADITPETAQAEISAKQATLIAQAVVFAVICQWSILGLAPSISITAPETGPGRRTVYVANERPVKQPTRRATASNGRSNFEAPSRGAYRPGED